MPCTLQRKCHSPLLFTNALDGRSGWFRFKCQFSPVSKRKDSQSVKSRHALSVIYFIFFVSLKVNSTHLLFIIRGQNLGQHEEMLSEAWTSRNSRDTQTDGKCGLAKDNHE